MPDVHTRALAAALDVHQVAVADHADHHRTTAAAAVAAVEAARPPADAGQANGGDRATG